MFALWSLFCVFVPLRPHMVKAYGNAKGKAPQNQSFSRATPSSKGTKRTARISS
ncbi:hypothetical protein SAMN04488037_108140 [Shimia marina]|uniref:Uncharacterized protein n=1 Tax=Shimia marina TaxID=321267 RepID=A0A0N7LRE9_9RHOB|nr:hypothetical protein SHM7688_00055 [Shimia marina]SFE38432.1 hypothetical protein SAMN04488037_108140 [Shimia marina]